jgi:hypothetical protein
MKTFTHTLALLLLAAGASLAQESVAYGSVSGRVLDPSSAAVKGAEVVLRQRETNVVVRVATAEDGRFRLAYVAPGDYEFTVTQAGFAQARETLRLGAGSAFELPVGLRIASVGDGVTVEAAGALVEAARTQIAGAVGRTELESLPLNGRSFLDLALLIPGVSPTNTNSTQLFPETSAVAGQGLSVSSQRNLSNSFLVDGLSANDDAAGLSGPVYGLGAVEGLQVVTSGGQAELGRALGGYVNVTTRSGTNALHGELYGYLRNQRLNAANPLSNSKLPMTQAQYGASLGGPVRRDKTFAFGNFEQRNLNQSGLTTILPANVDAINARLAQVNYPGLRLTTGVYPNPIHATTLLGKLDHAGSDRSRSLVRYNLYDVASLHSRGAGGLAAASASSGLDNRDHTIAAGNVWTLSPRLVNEVRGQFTSSHLAALPTDAIGPAVNIAGVAQFGTLSGSPTGRENKMVELADNLSHQHGAHALRAGADLLYNSTTITFPRARRGSYAFSSLANFLSGTYNNSGFTQNFGETVVAQHNPNTGFYIQDEWKVTTSLTLNLGLRYDLQWLETIHTDRNNLSPRAGLAWAPFASRKTVIRASYGLFYDRVPLRAVANALLSAGNTTDLAQLRQTGISLSPTQAGAPVFPNILAAAVPAVTLPNLTTMDRHLQNAYAFQGSFEIEQQLGAGASVSVAYQHLRGVHLLASINQNVPSCVAAGTNNGCRPNAAYANNSQYSPRADSNYNALHISFQQRASKRANYRISYAWSKSLNNIGEFFFSGPIDPFNIWRDYGRSDDDQRHRLTFNGALHPGFGFELSGLLQYYSALPLNITSGVTTIQGTAGRPIVNGDFIGRNTGTGSDLFQTSVRLSRRFALAETITLEAFAEAFNALNHRNNLTRNGNFGAGAYPSNPSASFGQVTSVLDPRGVQLAMRLRF